MPVQGWELTESWMKADAFSTEGFFYVNYYSGEGAGSGGCVADVALRKALLLLVRIDEADLMIDECNILEAGERVHKTRVGSKYVFSIEGRQFRLDVKLKSFAYFFEPLALVIAIIIY